MTNVNGQPRILVVDDNDRNSRLLESLLTRQGYRVSLAADGENALRQAQEKDLDLIILDVMMPGMDGYEVAREIRNSVDLRAIPILMLTALRELEDKIRGLEAGADDFLVKPFNTIELLARVRSLLRIKQLHDELQVKNALLERVLTRYVSQDIAQEILRNPDVNLQLGGRAHTISVLFADIRGFTRFAEQRDAGLVIEVLNEIFNRLTPVVFEYHGTLDKYLGDAVMAIYGAPVSLPNSTEAAVRTAWAMQQQFTALRDVNMQLGELGLGIGIATGEAVVGNVGSDQFMDYTVIGHTPNLAKRLQESAKSGQILIDLQTYERVSDFTYCTPTLPLYGEGLLTPVKAFEVMNLYPSPAGTPPRVSPEKSR